MTLEGFPNAVAEAQALDDALSSNGMKVSTVIYIDVVENQWLEKADPVLQEAENRAASPSLTRMTKAIKPKLATAFEI